MFVNISRQRQQSGEDKKKEKMKEIRKKGPAGRPCKTCAGLDHGDTPVIPQPSPPLLIWVEREGRFTAALDFSLSSFSFSFQPEFQTMAHYSR
jgi:hypothetical protein